MSRIASRTPVAAALAALLVAACSATAAVAPAPVPGPGAWGTAHPLWWDSTPDGVPQPGELTGFPAYDGYSCTYVVGYPTGLPWTQSPCANVTASGGVTGSIFRPSSGINQILTTDATGTHFTFSEVPVTPPPTPASVGRTVRALAPLSSGTGDLKDINSDGIYETLIIQGTGPNGPVPATSISLLPRDATGDGRPDYISVPWTTSQAGLLGVITSTTPQIFVPLTDTNADGWPDTITVQVANGGLVTTSGPALAGPAMLDSFAIPSLSSVGLLVFAAAVVAAGVKLLRGSLAVS
jgi:hypothetical protein